MVDYGKDKNVTYDKGNPYTPVSEGGLDTGAVDFRPVPRFDDFRRGTEYEGLLGAP